jgi:hypothetical protein
MLKPQQFRVQLADREYVLTVDGRDYMFYERETGDSAVDLISSGTQFSTWYMLAAAGSRRQGLFDGTPDDFYDQVQFVLPVIEGGDSGPADPTTPPEDSGSS